MRSTPPTHDTVGAHNAGKKRNAQGHRSKSRPTPPLKTTSRPQSVSPARQQALTAKKIPNKPGHDKQNTHVGLSNDNDKNNLHALKDQQSKRRSIPDQMFMGGKGIPSQLCVNYIRLTAKHRKGSQSCFQFDSAHFRNIMENLITIPRTKDHHLHPAALYCLKIWPGYAAIVYENTDGVMLCPNIHAGILAIDTTQPALSWGHRGFGKCRT